MSGWLPVLKSRILTVVVILPLFLAALFGLPQTIWGALLLAIVLAACIEWARLAALSPTSRLLFTAAVLLACAAIGLAQPSGVGEFVLAVALVLWLGIVPLWLRRTLPAPAVSLALAGVVILVSAWYALFELQRSAARLLALLGVVWVADTAAYFAGRRFGRHKLAPRISPGKTWEGVAGAAVGVGVYYGLLWLAWAPAFLEGDRLLDLALVAGMTMLSIEGDLFESWIKRRAGVKDSGTVLPGHGGVLDRIDGVVAALPLAALASIVGRG
ncbi:MAG: phosphatidate cytidylyltransferase [Betaproteobacteria bacterium]|nr:MAG: phosphatidate cytidylyltransferase [Betaproteobacteria bacterium]